MPGRYRRSCRHQEVAFGAAGLVFAGVYGAAAALEVDGGNAQAGQAADLSCDDNGVQVDGYLIEQGTGAEPLSFGIVVSGIDEACTGLFMTGRTLDGAGAILGDGVVEITGPTARLTYSPSTGVPVSQIQSVTLAIT